jgi:hypothetical protein
MEGILESGGTAAERILVGNVETGAWNLRAETSERMATRGVRKVADERINEGEGCGRRM